MFYFMDCFLEEWAKFCRPLFFLLAVCNYFSTTLMQKHLSCNSQQEMAKKNKNRQSFKACNEAKKNKKRLRKIGGSQVCKM